MPHWTAVEPIVATYRECQTRDFPTKLQKTVGQPKADVRSHFVVPVHVMDDFMHWADLENNMARVPLTYVSWTDVPEDVLEDIWKDVQSDMVQVPYEPYQGSPGCGKVASIGVLFKDGGERGRMKSFLAHDSKLQMMEGLEEVVPVSVV
ncbi:hypothetical protein QJS10_CPB12g01251 [Acorus calamus]|uniref:Uncharacterized protein n=1 Tax=Acorus calamus TaxID=4465 RepID=A0AAV9DIM8_ACOCL|nr:hypothetical protein QJS10_CPB12g01251 [Acorus calamus]